MPVTADLDLLNEQIGARVPIISVESPEETRVVDQLFHMTSKKTPYPFQKDKKFFLWDAVDGLMEMGTDGEAYVVDGIIDPVDVLEYIKAYQPPKDGKKGSTWGALFVLRDFHPYMDERTIRALRSCANTIKPTRKTILLVSPGFDIPIELQHDTDVFEFPLPNRLELTELVASSAEQAPRSITVDLDEDGITALVDALQGMTEDAARAAIGRAMVRSRTFSRAIIPLILEFKAAHIRDVGLEYIQNTVTLDQVGGMERLRDAIEIDEVINQPGAREFGVEPSKGVLIFGAPGTGKSLVAKTWASDTAPLFRLDLGALLDSLYGASENNLARALRLAEAVGATLWIDEFDRLFGGSGRQEDGGTTKRLIGKMLNWMQEQDSCMLIATGNDISGIDPALLRAGRFDRVVYVDLPGPRSRADILRIHLEKRQRKPSDFDLTAIAAETRGFGGAELEEGIKRVIRIAWREGQRPITTDDLINEYRQMTPLSVTMRETLNAMRQWAVGRAMPASDDAEEDLEEVEATRPRRAFTSGGSAINQIEA